MSEVTTLRPTPPSASRVDFDSGRVRCSHDTGIPMFLNVRTLIIALTAGLLSPATVFGDEKRPVVGCTAAVDNFFEDEVWAKVGMRTCLTCHRKGGDAEESKFVLMDP